MKPLIYIITGLSGSGKTIALRALEDAGYFCVDNLPPLLIETFTETITSGAKRSRMAIGIDIRGRELTPLMNATLEALREKYIINILFFEAEQSVLMRRYKETRRPHPLCTPKNPGIEQAMSEEAVLLAPLREIADRIIDTSALTPHQLRRNMVATYGEDNQTDTMNVTLLSFGFKHGLPQNSDLVFDARFLPNPHFVPELRPLDGRDPAVKDYVLNNPQGKEFIAKLTDMLDYLIPQYVKEGRSYLTISIGCTGGRHRSPAIAEQVASLITAKSVNTKTFHREF